MAHIAASDGQEANVRASNRVSVTARSGPPRSTTVDESLDREIETLVPRLRRYARTLTRDGVAADDLVQDCLASALAKIHMWEPGTDLRAWLFTILHNVYVNRLRRDARQRAHTELQKSYRILPLMPDQHIRLELRDVERALAELPEDQRSLILAIGLGGISYEDAASAFNLPLGTIRSRLARGREKLRLLTDHLASQVQ